MRKFTLILMSVVAAIGFNMYAQDLNVAGSYTIEKQWRGSKADPYSYNPRITYTGAKNEVKLTGIPKYTSGVFNPTIYGTVIPEQRQIRFYSDYMYTDQRYGDVWVQFYDLADGEAPRDYIIADVEEDGTIRFPWYAEMQFEVPALGDQGLLWVAYGISLTPIPDDTFIYNPNDWQYCGEAIFADNALSAFGEMAEDDWNTFCVHTPLYKHKTIEGDFLLMDPYGQDEEMSFTEENQYGEPMTWVGTMEDFLYQIYTWAGMQPYIEKPGFIRFNVADPDCIFVYPYVYTGVKVDWYSPGEYDDFYLYNYEGRLKTIENKSSQDIIRQFTSQGKDVSYYDYDDQCAYFFNLFVGTPQEPLGDITFYGEVDGTANQVRVKFDINVKPQEDDPNEDTGVSVIEEDENVPARYFNLQGLEVKNPQPGSLLIRKAGNDVKKVIIK